jgi:hypothetical protein
LLRTPRNRGQFRETVIGSVAVGYLLTTRIYSCVVVEKKSSAWMRDGKETEGD